jgi:hypothetical protein
VRRSKRRSIAERAILAAIFVRPFRCEGCRSRFFKLSLHKNVRPETVENSGGLTGDKTRDLLGRDAARLNLHLS